MQRLRLYRLDSGPILSLMQALSTRSPLSSPRTARSRLRAAALSLALGFCTAAAVAAPGADSMPILQLEAWLRGVPAWAFVLAFVLLPAFGFPVSLFYLSVGALFPTPALSLAVAWGCMALNMALSYWVARALARPVERLLHSRGYPLPRLAEGAQWRAVVLLLGQLVLSGLRPRLRGATSL